MLREVSVGRSQLVLFEPELVLTRRQLILIGSVVSGAGELEAVELVVVELRAGGVPTGCFGRFLFEGLELFEGALRVTECRPLRVLALVPEHRPALGLRLREGGVAAPRLSLQLQPSEVVLEV